MLTLLNQLTVLHDDEPICTTQRGEPVRNRDGGASAHQVVQGFLNFLLGLGVHRRGGFVHDQDAWVDQQGARNRDALTLAARQTLAALAHQGVVALRQTQNEFMRMGGTGRSHNLSAGGTWLAVGDVVGDGAEKQKRLLQHQTNVAAVIGDADVTNVGAINANGSFAQVVETANQVHQGAFARTALPHQTNHFARRNVQAQTFDDSPVAIAKTSIGNLNVPHHLGQGHRVHWLGDAGHVVEDFKNTFGASRRFLRV